MKIETEWDRAIRYYRNETARIEQPLITRIITKKEYTQLISEYWDLHPYRIIFQLLYETGMRPIEASWLQIENIDIEKRQIGYKVAKPYQKKVKDKFITVYKSRIVPITEDLASRLDRYIKLNDIRLRWGFLFPSYNFHTKSFHMNPRTLNSEMNRLRKKFGGRWLDKTSYGDHVISPHSFRRSWITRYLEKYGDIAGCSRDIGHNSLDTTFGYYQILHHDRLRNFVDSENITVNIPKLAEDQTMLNEFDP